MWEIGALPENCIAQVLSLTNPRDVCRLSLVSSTFRSAAESDSVWEQFLPSDYKDLISRALYPPPPQSQSTKKLLYLWLSDNPLVIDHGSVSFSIEKLSGRRCFMLAARSLSIVWADTPRYWRWISLPTSSRRFSEVAELLSVCWLEIRGKIRTGMLSPRTMYGAYLVFKSTPGAYGLDYQPAEVAVRVISGDEIDIENETDATQGQNQNTSRRTVYLDPEREQRQRYQIIPRRLGTFNFNTIATLRRMYRTHPALRMERGTEAEPEETETESGRETEDGRYPTKRGDGWMEVELGEYYHEGGEERELEMSLMEVKGGHWKTGLVVQGIEIRPK
ncbi:hypothetical protein NMG60_11031154 [Bertholletia excelsa]